MNPSKNDGIHAKWLSGGCLLVLSLPVGLVGIAIYLMATHEPAVKLPPGVHIVQRTDEVRLRESESYLVLEHTPGQLAGLLRLHGFSEFYTPPEPWVQEAVCPPLGLAPDDVRRDFPREYTSQQQDIDRWLLAAPDGTRSIYWQVIK